MKHVRLLAAVAVTAAAACTSVAPGGSAVAAGNTLVVNASGNLRTVTHVGAGGLYALATATVPTASELPPLHLNQLVQMAPGGKQLGNGATTPTGDALIVAPLAASAGAHEYVRMPDIYPNFPYVWVSWTDWLNKVNTMVHAKLASSAGSTVNGWELWNEPDWTWNTNAAGAFNAGWTRTFQAVRALDASTPIVGPSISIYNHAWMLSFLQNAKATNTVPNVISWHQLTSTQYSTIGTNVADVNAIEDSLGIARLPISIDEYAAQNEVDVPSAALHYIDNFERYGVTNASRAYWFESGTINGLLFNNKATSTYWLYKWYGDMTGHMLPVTASAFEDGIGSYDSSRKVVHVIFGGQAGNNAVQINGLTVLGKTSVQVVLSYTPSLGRQTNLAAPTTLSTTTYTVTNGSITVPINNQDYLGAYQLLVS
jgi:hypothetical protein